MSSKDYRMTAAADREQSARKAATEKGHKAGAKRDQPQEISERSLQQRQGKQLHKQDCK